MSNRESNELERVEKLFSFLQGTLPDGHFVDKKHIPKLTPDQAWTVIWYLGNQYWEVPDFIERCCLCGSLYDSEREGACLDYGRAPYHFCEQCRDSNAFSKKMRRNPDARLRKEFFAK